MTTIAGLRRLGTSIGGIIAAGLLGTLICRVASGSFVPEAAFAQAIVFGSLDALFAIGLVLVYRSGRIVNFAQGSLGILGVSLFSMLTLVEGWPFLVTLPIAIAVAAATGFAVEVLVVRRLANAPRLALTVVTIGVGQILLALASLIPLFFLGGVDEFIPEQIRTPLSGIRWQWSPLVFTGDHLLVVAVALAVMGGLAAFFRLSSAGIAVRGSAENRDRAELLGVSVSNLSSLVWVLAAALSGLAAVLALPISPGGLLSGGAGAASAGLLLRGLAAAVLGRMENLPVTVAAAIGIAVFDRAMFWAFDNTSLTNAALFALVVLVLLVQRAKLARTDEGTTGSWAASEEIRGIQVRTGVRRARLALAALALALPWVLSPAQTGLGSVYVIYGIVVVSLVVLTGWGGQISLGQFGFVAMGAVIGGSLTSRAGVPFLLAALIASTIGAGIAVAIGLPAMRIKGLFLAVTTLAFAVTVATVVLNRQFFGWLLPGSIERPKLLFLDTADERVFFYLSLTGLLFAYWVARGLRQSRAGRVLIAMRENERTAQSYGINRVRTRLATFAISGFLASFAGVLLAHQQLSVRPNAFTPEQSVQIFLIAVIGGLGSIGGALAGVAYIALVNLFIPFTAGQLFATGAGVVVILLFYPSGLGGIVFALRDAWLRRVAMRARIYVPSLVGNHRVLDGALTKVALTPVEGGTGEDGRGTKVPVKYRIPSAIGVRGESQQAHSWRYGA
jgi:branched-chain amino acid transport system permease protein